MRYEAVKHLSPFKSAKELKDAVRELLDRGLLFFVEDQGQYDLHPIVRQYAYDRLGDKEGVHTSLRDYFDAVPRPEEGQIQRVEDLLPIIELYHHTVRAGQYDQARELYRDRLDQPLYYRFGAYQTVIELLSALFPKGQPITESGQVTLPRLKTERAQSWTLNSLANSYSLSGQPRLAVPCYEKKNKMQEKNNDKSNLVTGLRNLAQTAQLPIGELAAAEQNLRRSLGLSREIEDEFSQAVEHEELGRLLAYRDAFQESARELDAAMERFTKQHHVQGEGVTWAYRALRLLLMGRPERALDAARQARQKVDERARADYPVERSFVEAERLQGAALVAMAAEEEGRRDELLSQAEPHLTDALARCRRINLVEFEPDILLAWAKWHRLRGNTDQALRDAAEALGIADRSEYRLNQADLHLFLAQLALDQGDRPKARRHAETAHERALCDGPPHCYQPALEQAERLLRSANER